MTYISDSLVANVKRDTSNAGRLCFQNIATKANTSATSSAQGFPVSNVANPLTAYGWSAGNTADQTITISNGNTSPVDYIGIARHNLSQPAITVRIRLNGQTVRDYAPVPDKQALLFLFATATPHTVQIDIRIQGDARPAELAVLYVGQSVTLERDIYVGHTPITYGRDRTVINGVSQSGDFLGEINLTQTQSTGVALENLTPKWYRENLDRYFASVPRNPCFWAWRPGTYPTEVGFCWVEGNPRPVNQRNNGMMSINWNFRGIE